MAGLSSRGDGCLIVMRQGTGEWVLPARFTQGSSVARASAGYNSEFRA